MFLVCIAADKHFHMHTSKTHLRHEHIVQFIRLWSANSIDTELPIRGTSVLIFIIIPLLIVQTGTSLIYPAGLDCHHDYWSHPQHPLSSRENTNKKRGKHLPPFLCSNLNLCLKNNTNPPLQNPTSHELLCTSRDLILQKGLLGTVDDRKNLLPLMA